MLAATQIRSAKQADRPRKLSDSGGRHERHDHYVLKQLEADMRYAMAHDFAKQNPVAGIKPADVLKPHKRRNYPRVEAGELPDVMHAIDTYVDSEHTRLALQLMAFTFVVACHSRS